MADPDAGNRTAITEFVLLGFGDLPDLRVLLFLLFLGIYLATMGVNSLVLLVVVADRHLHTPMYFFLGNLSCLETCYSSAILPRMLPGLLTGDRTISVTGCITQIYFFGVLAATECYLLAAMSYDRYLAICRPLHYSTLMNSRSCLCLAAGSWLSGWFAATLFIVLLSGLMFCGPHDIDNFYCDVIPVVKLACGDTRPMVVLDFALACVFTLPPFLLTLTSYACILAAILRIPSTAGQQRAFSTCSSHLIVVSVFYGTLLSVSMLPTLDTLSALKKVLSLCYSILTPLLNPLIYSLRNREVRRALSKALAPYGSCTETRRNAPSVAEGKGFKVLRWCK